jgi:hypothetical protein
MRTLLGMGLLSAATLLSQVALTRVFSIAQFYHFAFLVVSLALLGFGASGSLLALWPCLQKREYTAWYANGFALSTILSYLFVNHLPFDSYSIAWDRAQAYLLIANLLVLAAPFVFAGLLVGALLSRRAANVGRIYAANLIGSAAGALLAPLIIAWVGSERTVLWCAVLGMGAAVILAPIGARILGLAGLMISVALLVVFPPPFEARLSPYKRLSQFRLNPEASILATRQNAYARLDLVRSSTIHSAQGLSLAYLGELPPQIGLLVDGDNMLPVPDTTRASGALARSIPAAVAHAIRPAGDVLVLGSGGGMDVWAALANGARHVTVVEPNQLVYDALLNDLRAWIGLSDDPRVTAVQEEIRTYTQRSTDRYDVVELALSDNYRPISSGAFTLTENYTLTVEAFKSYLNLSGQDGILVLTRWIQSPPSESLRTLGILIEALDGRPPLEHIVAFRSFQTVTFIVKMTPLTPEETTALLKVIERLRYDLVIAPRMPPEMINRFARLPSPVEHDLSLKLATTPDRAAFYAAYAFDIAPPTDEHPFFFHFFRWEQTPEVIENLGRRWQPFGGSGYFVLLALLGFALMAALVFVLLPVALRQGFRHAIRRTGARRSLWVVSYFTAIGLAFLLVEMALIQRFILALGQPTLAMALVIGALLLSSGLGSSLANRLPWRLSLTGLAALIAFYPWLTGLIAPLLLELPFAARVVVVMALIAPPGLLMGVPFARGIAALRDADSLIPWAWAANGSASVVSAVLAVMLSLSFNFTVVLLIGGGLYLIAAGLAISQPTGGSVAQTLRQ